MRINPVMEKELKVKMRGWKAPALITSYLGFLGLVVWMVFVSNNYLSRYYAPSFNPRVALSAYNVLAILQFCLLMFIIPPMTGGAVSGERERQTLDLLLCTNFHPLSIVLGKMSATVAHAMLLITASLPIMGTVFLFGGIRLRDLLLLMAFYLVTALFVASMGIFYSTVFRRSTVAIIMSYLTLGALSVGTFVFMAMYYVFRHSLYGTQFTYGEVMLFLTPNPIYAFSMMLENSDMGFILLDIFFGIRRIGMAQGSGMVNIKPWAANMIFNTLAAMVFILLASWRIRIVKKPLLKKRGRL